MYIKKTKKTDSRTGKSYFAYSLIESTRTDKGPRQRVLLYLGTDLSLPEGELKMLAERIEEIFSGYDKSMLSYPKKVERLAQHYASQLVHRLSKPEDPQKEIQSPTDFNTIDVASIEKLEPRTVGAEHLLLQMANQLDLRKKFKEIGLSEKEIALSLGTII